MILRQADDDTALTATWDTAATPATELFRYVYRPGGPQLESPRPYFHPVRTLHGDLVSLYRPHDHVWHKGISLSLPNVGDHNFWGGPTFRAGKYVQARNDGSMVQDGFDLAAVTSAAEGDDTIRIDERLSWVTELTRETLITERRRIAATAWPDADAWCLAFETTLTNATGTNASGANASGANASGANASGADIVLGSPTTEGRPNAGYGGLFWRGPRSFTGGTVLTPDGPDGGEVMGRRAPWLGFTGQHEGPDRNDGTGRASTLVFRDDERNFAHPTQWFVRGTPYAGVCPAPFFDTEHVLAAGASLTLRYDIAVAAGALDATACAGLAARAASRDPLP